MNLFVVIPAYNEEETISRVIKGVKKYTENIIVVDDGSTDSTLLILKKIDAYVLQHQINLGKGAALKTGCQAAIRLGAEIIITIDGDGQHEPSEIPKLTSKLKKENLDIILGARQMNKNMPKLMLFGNKFLNKIINLFLNTPLADTQSGFKAFTSQTYQKIKWQSSDYSVETEIIMRINKNKLKYQEVPIKTIYQDAYKGTTIIDGIKILFNIIKWKLL